MARFCVLRVQQPNVRGATLAEQTQADAPKPLTVYHQLPAGRTLLLERLQLAFYICGLHPGT